MMESIQKLTRKTRTLEKELDRVTKRLHNAEKMIISMHIIMHSEEVKDNRIEKLDVIMDKFYNAAASWGAPFSDAPFEENVEVLKCPTPENNVDSSEPDPRKD